MSASGTYLRKDLPWPCEEGGRRSGEEGGRNEAVHSNIPPSPSIRKGGKAHVRHTYGTW